MDTSIQARAIHPACDQSLLLSGYPELCDTRPAAVTHDLAIMQLGPVSTTIHCGCA